MEQVQPRVGAIVLGAGKGKRMESELPKVLLPFHGKPLVQHVLNALRDTSVVWPPTVVIGYRADLVRDTLGDEYQYVLQTEPRGTGHAVLSARSVVEGTVDHVVVLYGDMPLIPAATINELIKTHLREQTVMSLITVQVPDFNDWRASLFGYGRVVRGADGAFEKIVELKDASQEQRAITEVNPSFFCFRAEWLWRELPKLKSENAQQEYYLTDLLQVAAEEGARIATIAGDPREALGANTKEELETLGKI